MNTDRITIKKRYDRLAPYFDSIEAVMEGLLFKKWRKRLWTQTEGEHILEIGVGTGKNFEYYPLSARMTAIDFSDKMLEVARRKKKRKKIDVDLHCMDVESLDFADNCFDTVVASFVFCSVPSPRKGLKEIYRVLKPGGQIVLLEHVLSSKPALAKLMNWLNPLVLSLVGANINRQTIKNVQASGFNSIHVDSGSGDIIKLIQARK